MIKLITVILSTLVIIALFLLNSIIALFIVKISPDTFIYNQSYRAQHMQTVNYILSGKEGDLKNVLPRDEFNHIKDVRSIVAKIPLVIFFIIVLVSFLIKKYQTITINDVIKYSFILICIFLTVAVFLFMPFFIFFHEILFPQGNWSFTANSILIQLYPESFWRNQMILNVILAIIELIVIKKLPFLSTFTSPKHSMV